MSFLLAHLPRYNVCKTKFEIITQNQSDPLFLCSGKEINNHAVPQIFDVSFPLYAILIEISTYFQFSSVAQSCPTLCDPMDCSTPGFPVHHQLPELAQTHVHRIGDAIQPSHPLLSPFTYFTLKIFLKSIYFSPLLLSLPKSITII